MDFSSFQRIDHLVRCATNDATINIILFSSNTVLCLRKVGDKHQAIKSFVDGVGVQWYNAWMRSECAGAIADYAKVKPENVFVCNGSAETLVVIAEVFLEPGDELLTFYPTYRVLLNYSKIYGSTIVKVHHEKDFNADRLPGKIIDKISSKTKIIK